ncbi:hypothetical protein KAR91_19710 [Candidatus Pacearchaeota archaeon]|nr:hypothetical protein [Candidatus Pacearchaeota archaeon]
MAEDRHYAFIPKTTTHSTELNALPLSARWLYVILAAERHGRKVKFTAPYNMLHKTTGLSTATIRKAIVSLEGAGFLTYEHGGLEQNPNQYEMEESWLEVD